MLHVQSCFFANYTYFCFFTVLVPLAAQHYAILYFVWANYKSPRASLSALAKSIYYLLFEKSTIQPYHIHHKGPVIIYRLGGGRSI